MLRRVFDKINNFKRQTSTEYSLFSNWSDQMLLLLLLLLHQLLRA
jgi:hypothetical protein